MALPTPPPPPNQPPEPNGPWGAPTLPPPPPLLAPAAAEEPPRATPVKRAHLTVGWRWLLAIGWGLVLSALGLVANVGFLLGDSPFWLVTGIAPFVLPGITLVALAYDRKHALLLSFLSVGVLALIGLVDLLHARAMGVAELTLSVAALAISVAALAGRIDHHDTDDADDTVGSDSAPEASTATP